MKIKTKKIKEMNYNEITDENQDIKEGDILLIKEEGSNKWVAQFVTMITNTGMYLHPEDNKLDDGGIIFWPEYIKEQHKEKQLLLNNDKFIHIVIDREEMVE